MPNTLRILKYTPRLRLMFSLMAALMGFIAGIQSQATIVPERITIKDGLSQGYVSSIYQDREGFIWIGTKNGLNRYDGRDFQVFTKNPSDPSSISDDWTTGIAEIGDHLAVMGIGGGLDIYSRKTKRFHHIAGVAEHFQMELPTPTLRRDSLGRLWIHSPYGDKLIRVQFSEQFWLGLENDTVIQSAVVIKPYTQDISHALGFIDNGKSLLVLTADGGAAQINITSGEIRAYPIADRPVWEKGQVYLLKGDRIIGLDKYGLLVYEGGNVRKVSADFRTMVLIAVPELDQLWVRTEEDMLLYSTDVLNQRAFSKSDAIAILPEFVGITFAQLTDRTGIGYIGTTGYGLLKINQRHLRIKHVFPGKSVYGVPFATDSGEIIVRNPMPYGVHYYPGTDPKFEFIARYLEDEAEAIVLHSAPDQYWLVTNNERRTQIRAVDPARQSLSLMAEFENTSPGNFAATTSESGNILIACEHVLAVYDIRRKMLTLHDMSPHSSGENGHYCMIEAHPNEFWIGSPGGLVKAVLQDGQFEFNLFEEAGHGQNGLQNNHVAALLKDRYDASILWIGTKGGGLQKLDTRTLTFTTFNTQHGLPNNVIYGILDDDHGNLWLSSNKGITRFHPASGKVTNFVEADGLQSDEFNTFAYAKTPNGQMLFGGILGMNVFHPDDLVQNQISGTPYLTDLLINNIPIHPRDSTGILDLALEYTESITLPYSKNNVTLHFVSTEYTAPFKNRFQYYLEGAENPWANESSDDHASYLNLGPGSYTFRLRSSNNDGVWSGTTATLQIRITPPWYRSILAYILYAALIVFVLWRLVRMREGRIKILHEVQIKQNEAARLVELDKVKSKLYTNITHEFRTPLTVISGIAEEMDASRVHKDLIKNNSDQLLELVNQMLDLRKLESDAMPVAYEQLDCIVFLRYLVEAYSAFAESKGLTLTFTAGTNSIMMDVDRQKLTRIMSNLLSNAIKFTPSGGAVDVTVKPIQNEAQDSLQITVRDSGIGIPPASLDQIFNRFYQVDDSSTRSGEGTGIGLTLVKEFVHLLGGQITVTSEPGKGSAFRVSLPVTHNAQIGITASEASAFFPRDIAPPLDEDHPVQGEHVANGNVPRVLIIEDSPDVVKYLRTCLTDIYDLEVAINGAEGIEKATETVPDIIISDVMMPLADGFEVCNTLKLDERTSHIPIILLTAKADITSRIEGLKRGADAYIAKPFHKQELLVELRKLITLRKLLQSRYRSLELPEVSDDPGTQIEDAFIQKFRAVVEANLDDADFDVPALCKAIGISRTQLHRKITALTGMSTSEFQRSIRLNRAKMLLEKTDQSISEIAYEVGFRDPNYFSKAFSSVYGLSPTEFRSSALNS